MPSKISFSLATKLVSPVASTAQKIRITNKKSEEGGEVGSPRRSLDVSAIAEDDDNVTEDCRILGAPFSQNPPYSFSKSDRTRVEKVPIHPETRKKKMSYPAELSKHHYDTDREYTFEFYQHVFDPLTFHMNVIGMTTVDVAELVARIEAS